jgi:thymidylate synthase (FAD)
MSPRVYLLGRPHFDREYEEFLRDILPPGEASWRCDENATPAERLVEFAGRVCYMSFGMRQSCKTNAEYIQNFIRQGHESVLEHAVWTLAIAGVSRALTHQLVRHRVGFAFSQLSQQYHDQSEAKFVRPPQIEDVPEAGAAWDNAIRETQLAYKKILSNLEAQQTRSYSRSEVTRALRSAARSVLPNATETALVVTVNARAARHFLKLRGTIVGDVEMRCTTAALLEVLRPEGPAFFADFSVKYLDDGLPLLANFQSFRR